MDTPERSGYSDQTERKSEAIRFVRLFSREQQDPQDISDVLRRFEILSNMLRLRVFLVICRTGPIDVQTIKEKVCANSQASVSYHLGELRGAGLVKYERRGKYNYYSIVEGSLGGVFTTKSKQVSLETLSLLPTHEIDSADSAAKNSLKDVAEAATTLPSHNLSVANSRMPQRTCVALSDLSTQQIQREQAYGILRENRRDIPEWMDQQWSKWESVLLAVILRALGESKDPSRELLRRIDYEDTRGRRR